MSFCLCLHGLGPDVLGGGQLPDEEGPDKSQAGGAGGQRGGARQHQGALQAGPLPRRLGVRGEHLAAAAAAAAAPKAGGSGASQPASSWLTSHLGDLLGFDIYQPSGEDGQTFKRKQDF